MPICRATATTNLRPRAGRYAGNAARAANFANLSQAARYEIDGKLHCWRDLVARRREQLRGYAAAVQPPLFELIDDCEPLLSDR
jgi:hypothetical protein